MKRRTLSLLSAGLLPLALAGATARCIPSLGPGDSLVTSTRILAVRAEPAEATPGKEVTFTALVAGPGGTESAGITWSFCTAPKPLTEDNVVSSACLGGAGGPSLVAAGSGPSVTTRTPGMGCSIFGPDVGLMGLRPRDPDATGGYYQPLLAQVAGSDAAIELARIHCDLANASADAASAFASAYHDNQNPQLLALTATIGGSSIALTSVPRSAHVVLRASWPAASAETFAYYDPSSQIVTHRREAMQVAWYSSGGTLDTESTGRAADDPATTSDNGWAATGSASTVHLWIVLRDNRGGVDFASQDVTVGP